MNRVNFKKTIGHTNRKKSVTEVYVDKLSVGFIMGSGHNKELPNMMEYVFVPNEDFSLRISVPEFSTDFYSLREIKIAIKKFYLTGVMI